MEDVTLFFNAISSKQWQQLNHYVDLLLDWNAKINLISRKDQSLAFERHILPILPAKELHCLENAKNVLDIGTGGGIPGIPLAILYPKIQFTLLDSIHKKIKAVTDMVSALNLLNVNCICERLENLNISYDVCVGRGVTAFEPFINGASARLHKKGGRILYWTGGDLQDLMPYALRKKIQIIDLESFYQQKFCQTKKILSYSKLP